MVSPFLPDADKIAAVRAALPATSAGIYLNTAAAGPLPRETVAAMSELAEYELRAGRGHPDDQLDARQRLDEARAAVASVVGADPGAITLTHGRREALALALEAADWRPGDALVALTPPDDAAFRGPLAALARRGVRVVELTPDAADDQLEAEIEGALARRPRIVLAPHVADATGRLLPIERLAARAHAAGASLVVDGSSAAGAIPVQLDELGADAYLVASERWLLGPAGIGALWLAGAPPGPGPATVAALDVHGPSVLGFARSIGWLAMFVGWGFVHRRTALLVERLGQRLRAAPGVSVLTPAGSTSPILAIRIAGWPSDRALAELQARVFLVAEAPAGRDVLRLSVGFFNVEEELDRLAAAVELLAAHTPESLPSRPRLTVLRSDR